MDNGFTLKLKAETLPETKRTSKKTVYWRHLPDGRYEFGYSHDEQHEPVSVVADKEDAQSWVRVRSFEHN